MKRVNKIKKWLWWRGITPRDIGMMILSILMLSSIVGLGIISMFSQMAS